MVCSGLIVMYVFYHFSAREVFRGARIIELHEANKPKHEPLSNEKILTILSATTALATAEDEWLWFARELEKSHEIRG